MDPLAKEYFECEVCHDEDAVHISRWELGYHVCRKCGDQLAHEARLSWCVVQEYGKGPYQFVTSASAHRTLLDTNQKSPRS